jgi:enoyl-CoA hydratase/carnithine racemase
MNSTTLTQAKAPSSESASYIIVERRGNAGLITLNRPKALNALSLSMVRDLTTALTELQADPAVMLVAVRGSNKVGRPGTPEALFGGFSAGGDIRYFHQAILANDPSLDEFFTEEYTLNHLIHQYAKPFVAFMDGVVMGGGMGISQGASLRLVTEHTRMAMPETNIGLFPDVGGGYFLSRCPGYVGEYLALTGDVIGADEALQYGLADVKLDAARMPLIWAAMGTQVFSSINEAKGWLVSEVGQPDPDLIQADSHIDSFFSLLRVKHMVDALEKAKDDRWAQKTATSLRKRSPLMLHVTLEQIRRARQMTLADDLRMERDMVQHSFYDRPGTASEVMEGIRALVIDKDYTPKWNPARIEDVKPGMADEYFVSPWTTETHPLKAL